MKTTTFENHITVTFTITGEGNELVERSNSINELVLKNKAQQGLYENKSPWKMNYKGDIIGTQIGSIGGSITFHAHNCNHQKASTELVTLLEGFGLNLCAQLQEVIETHRADGTPYKMPQHSIKRI